MAALSHVLEAPGDWLVAAATGSKSPFDPEATLGHATAKVSNALNSGPKAEIVGKLHPATSHHKPVCPKADLNRAIDTMQT
jgi:hypothetical protein